ncbi:MAG: glycosyltransferase family 4 protein [DPANN group archaeon]|nr:glycosyltransferase family 4 protein [DPANN group archaeon]
MKVLHLSWEFPPYKVGGIGTVLEDLTKSQVAQGIEPIIVTCGFEGNVGYEHRNGVHIYRFDADYIPAEDFHSWALQMGMLMQNKACEVINEHKDIKIIHAHDWLVATAGIGLKHIYRIPMISTLHALESGRYGGIEGDRQELIHSLEKKLAYESWRIICNSEFMKRSISYSLSIPWDKIDVIPNGVDIGKMKTDFDYNHEKSKYALPHEKIVFYVGRMVWEKGVDILVGAIPAVLKRNPNAKFVFAGTGYMTDRLKKIAHDIGVSDKVNFVGFVDDDTLKRLFRISSAFAIPSRYEPFGITALEAMACSVPVVVSDTGGLAETVNHEVDGIKVWPESSESLAWGINKVLSDDNLAHDLSENAYKKINEHYNWSTISQRLKDIYNVVFEQYTSCDWKPSTTISGVGMGVKSDS